jgi:hypothetical protein
MVTESLSIEIHSMTMDTLSLKNSPYLDHSLRTPGEKHPRSTTLTNEQLKHLPVFFTLPPPHSIPRFSSVQLSEGLRSTPGEKHPEKHPTGENHPLNHPTGENHPENHPKREPPFEPPQAGEPPIEPPFVNHP